MAYLGNAPARSFISFERQVFTIVNSQTAYTLSHSVTNENDIRLVVNNIVQEPGSGKAYTASGTTLTLSAALTNGTDEMYCVFLGRAVGTVNAPAGSVSTSQLAGDAVTEAKIADGAVESEHLNNNVISGQTELAAEPADTDEFLISDAGTLKRIDYSHIKGGGCWEKLDTITISGTTSQIEHEEANFTSTHRDYKIMLSNVGLTGDAQIRMRIAGDGGTLLSTSDYRYAVTAYKSNNSENNQSSNGDTSFFMGGTNSSGGNASYGQNFEINLYNPLSTSTYLHWSSVGMQPDDNDYPMTNVGAGLYVAADSTAMKRFVLYLSSGDFNAGTSTLYGRIA